MIKRRFYKEEHKEKDVDSDSASSSSSDSDIEAEPTEVLEQEEVASEAESEDLEEAKEEDRAAQTFPFPSLSSGHDSEDSSLDEVPADSSGMCSSDDEIESIKKKKKLSKLMQSSKTDADDSEDALKYVLVSKSVFKCRICPKIVCLNEETLKTHLQSKKHSRSEKQLSNGKLKCILNSDGEEENLEEEGETHAERHARILSLTKLQEEEPKKKKIGGRQRQRLRSQRKKNDSATTKESEGKEIALKKKRRRKDIK